MGDQISLKLTPQDLKLSTLIFGLLAIIITIPLHLVFVDNLFRDALLTIALASAIFWGIVSTIFINAYWDLYLSLLLPLLDSPLCSAKLHSLQLVWDRIVVVILKSKPASYLDLRVSRWTAGYARTCSRDLRITNPGKGTTVTGFKIRTGFSFLFFRVCVLLVTRGMDCLGDFENNINEWMST
ncbi:MAG: hypothetical protein JSV37_12390 [Anaerolineaceae bacterium]|nr:MAG: hypothetical protein JSV37_12390 [Anaerolineaceae bacterium]